MDKRNHISSKLSVGICSTALSMFVLGMPGLVHADEASPAPANPSENNQLTLPQEQKAITPATTEAPAEKDTEKTTANSEETNVSELPKETVAIITEQPVEAPATSTETKPAPAEPVTSELRDTTAVPEDGLTGDERAEIAERATYKPLTQEYAQLIAQGKIHLENNTYDQSLYGKDILDPEGDDDGDGIKNKDEIYIYEKHGKEYLGYYSHPKLNDSDGDGLLDNEDDFKTKWYMTDRDLALFMELSYRDDHYIQKVLDETKPFYDVYKDRNEYKVINKELAPYWKVSKTYHLESGLDAVLFETRSRLPFLGKQTTHVLAFRGTEPDSYRDWFNDLTIATGNNPSQADDAKKILDELARDRSIQELYVTGHSLGGYLAQRFAVEAYQHYPHFYANRLRNVVTFNAPKVVTARTVWNAKNGLWDVGLISKQLAEAGKIKHYVAENDGVVGPGLRNDDDVIFNIGVSPHGHGSRYYVDTTVNSGAYSAHFNIGKRDWTANPTGYHNAQLDAVHFKKKEEVHLITKPAPTPKRNEIAINKRRPSRPTKKTNTSQNLVRGIHSKRSPHQVQGKKAKQGPILFVG